MELLSDVGHVKFCFGPFGDSVHISARNVHGLRQTYFRLRNRFGRTRQYFQATRFKWKLVSVCLEIVLILTQDRCSVCVEGTIGSEIILDARDGTPTKPGSCGIMFWSVWRLY